MPAAGAFTLPIQRWCTKSWPKLRLASILASNRAGAEPHRSPVLRPRESTVSECRFADASAGRRGDRRRGDRIGGGAMSAWGRRGQLRQLGAARRELHAAAAAASTTASAAAPHRILRMAAVNVVDRRVVAAVG